jgi:Flp pilus assembly protein TadB
MTEPDAAQERVETEQDQESLKDRLEREHNELLQELRSLIPGAEVLFGFLLAISFTEQFDQLTDGQRWVYYGTLVSTAVALVFYLAPAAHHRLRFRAGDKEFMLRKGNREAIAGTVAASLALTGVIYLVTALVFGTTEALMVAVVFFLFLAWRWWAYALLRAWRGRELEA